MYIYRYKIKVILDYKESVVYTTDEYEGYAVEHLGR